MATIPPPSPHHGIQRRLMQAKNNSTTHTTEATQIDHRDNFELFATVVGVLGGITLITGFAAFTWNLFKTHKGHVREATNREALRRAKEGELLEKIIGHKKSVFFSAFGSNEIVAPVQTAPERTVEVQPAVTSMSLEQSDPKTEQVERQGLFVDEATTAETGDGFQYAVQVVIRENLSLVEQVLTDNPDLISQADTNGNTLLHYAQTPEIINYLLRRGANPDRSNNNGHTSVHVAAANSNITALTLLLDWMEVIPFDDLSALFHIAARSGDAALLRYLTNRGLHRPLQFERRHLATVRTAQQSLLNPNGATLLHEAAGAANLDAVIYILKSGLIDVNATDDHGNTSLHIAALNVEINAVLEQIQGQTISADTPNIINTLLSNGANINSQNHEGFTPVHRAVLRRNHAILEVLLAHRPNLNIRANGYTPVELACQKNNGEAVTWLAPQSTLTDRRRRTRLLQQLIQLNHTEVLNVLTPESAANLFDVNAQDTDGNTTLHIACLHSREDLVEALLKLGAKRHMTNDSGQTARDLALTRKHHISAPIVRLLDKPEPAEQTEATVVELVEI